MIEGGYLKNMGAISGGLEKIWNKKQFLLHSLLQLKLWLVPNFFYFFFLGGGGGGGMASSTKVTFIPVLHEPGQPGAAIFV